MLGFTFLDWIDYEKMVRFRNEFYWQQQVRKHNVGGCAQ